MSPPSRSGPTKAASRNSDSTPNAKSRPVRLRLSAPGFDGKGLHGRATLDALSPESRNIVLLALRLRRPVFAAFGMAFSEHPPETVPVGYDHLSGPDLLDAEGETKVLETLAELQIRPDSLSDLLDDVTTLLVQYVVFPSDAAVVAVALWTAHTHAVESFDTTPRLAILSAEKESGKTRLLEVLNHVCASPVFTPNLTTAALLRLIDARQPTVLLDEADAIFNPRAHHYEELRGLLNAGYRRGATVPRVVGEGSKMRVKEFAAFTPVALAGIGKLPDTIISRAVLVRMRRRSPVEAVQPFRERVARRELEPIRERLEGWALEAVRICRRRVLKCLKASKTAPRIFGSHS